MVIEYVDTSVGLMLCWNVLQSLAVFSYQRSMSMINKLLAHDLNDDNSINYLLPYFYERVVPVT